VRAKSSLLRLRQTETRRRFGILKKRIIIAPPSGQRNCTSPILATSKKLLSGTSETKNISFKVIFI
jgi:hypothetical protein